MKLFELLRILDPELVPKKCKVHLAATNTDAPEFYRRQHKVGKKVDPLDEYRAERFEAFQSWQKSDKFNRAFVVSMVELNKDGPWLFVGAYDSKGYENNAQGEYHKYDLAKRPATEELCGRLVVAGIQKVRAFVRNAETIDNETIVAEIRAKRLQFAAFPGFANVKISKDQLDSIVRQEVESWKSALAHVSGIYVITDTKTGKLYVGSATGQERIWGRWCDYANNGHGGNDELKELLFKNGEDYAAHFQYSILETADTKASKQDIGEREEHWKQVLLSRTHGNNRN